MAEQALDHPADERQAAGIIGGTHAGLAPAALMPVQPIPGWRCLPDAVIRAYGEEGPVDLAALHPQHGVALIAFLDEGEEASPEEAREALQAMLRDEGLPRVFPGELPIVALPVERMARAQLARAVERAFAGMPAPTLAPGWLDWLTERLAAERLAPAPAVPRLLAPRRDEPEPKKIVSALLLTEVAEPAVTAATPRLLAPRRDEQLGKAAGDIVLAALARTAGAPVGEQRGHEPAPANEVPKLAPVPPRTNWLDWGVTLGFALGIAAALIAGLAAVLRNGRLF